MKFNNEIIICLYRNIVSPTKAEYPYFSDDFRLKIFLRINLDYSI